MEEFKNLGISKTTLNALEKKGFVTPSPIQAQTIPLLLEGKYDVIGQAQTGTGKTACFAIPIIENIESTGDVKALILAPTRELAMQVAKEIDSIKGDRRLSSLCVYGGSSIVEQMRALRKGVDIVVGTPGRVIDLINRGSLVLKNIKYAVLDEADEMLNMGFLDDIKEILSATPEDKKMLFFSATMPDEILRIAKKFMREYKVVRTKAQELTIDLVDQIFYYIKAHDRIEAIKRIVAVNNGIHGIIFCKTRATTDNVAHKLINQNYKAAAIHGDIAQSQREKTLELFKQKKIDLLVATDVAARGIDVNNLSHVINFSLPQSAETYVHRIGRTGRAGNKGTAITFLIPSEKSRLKYVERIVKKKLVEGKLPTVKEIIENKKSHIAEIIEKIITADKIKEYENISNELLSKHDPTKVVSAILKYAFQNELSHSSYKEFEQMDYSAPTKKERRSRDGRRDVSRGSRGGRSRSRDGRRDDRGYSRPRDSDRGGFDRDDSGKRRFRSKSTRRREERERDRERFNRSSSRFSERSRR
jgi:ATP-dependent RNA helicase DeaD